MTTLDHLKVNLSAPELAVEPGSVAELVISVRNLSEVVDQYQLEVLDLDPRWVEVLIGSVSLFPNDEDSLRAVFKPPRDSSARAGEHSFRVLVRSREYPEPPFSATLILKIAPFTSYDAKLAPERLVTKGRGSFELSLTNTGNCPLAFDLSATDNEQGCLLEFKPSQVTVEPGQSGAAKLEAEPKQKPKIGSSKTYNVAAVAQPKQAEARALAAQVVYQPPIPRWVPGAAIAAAVVAIALIMLLLRSSPVIQTFQVIPPTPIKAGQEVTLNWDVIGAGKVAISPQPGENLDSKGSVKLTPTQTTVYKIVAKKGWSSPAEKELTVKVEAELRQFEAAAGSQAGGQIEVPSGERVLLRWDAAGVEKVNISGLGTRPAKGQEMVPAVATTDYILKAEGAQLEGHVLVTVTEAPVIQTFMPQPAQITKGQPSTLTWNVTGVKTVQISPGIGSVSAAGSRVVRPKRSTDYVLTATNSAGTRQLTTSVEVEEQEGTVAAVLAAKPAQELPFIRKFEAYPNKVGILSQTSISWEVIGADRVVIEPDFGEVEPTKGRVKTSFKLPGTKAYTLTATNSLGKSTAKIKIAVGL